MFIGSAAGSTNFFSGIIDELLIYDRSLSASEIYALAQSTVTGIGTAQFWLQPDQAMLPLSPTLSYDFAEAAGSAVFADDSGNGYHATCSACPTSTNGWTDDAALRFDGLNDGLSIVITGGLSLTRFTQSAWIYPTFTDNGYHAVIGYQPPLNQQRPPIIYVTEKTKIHAGFGNGTTFEGFNTGSVLKPDAWNHVATTFDGTSYRVYINGTGVYTSTALAGKVPYPVSQLRIGQADNYFKGSIDQVRVYNRALAASDIALLASNWQNATLSTTASRQATWSYATPGGLEGLYQLNLRGQDVYSNTESIETVWRGMIDGQAPRLTLQAVHQGGGYAAATKYTIVAADSFIDTARLVAPCVNGTTSYTYHSGYGLINQIVLTCIVAGHQQGTWSATAYDYAGNRTTATATLNTPTNQADILITSPASTIIGTQPISITGGAYAPSGIQKVTVRVDGTLIKTLIYGGTITNTLWATTWQPQTTGMHTITAILTSQNGGVYTATLATTVLAAATLTVNKAGTGSGTVASVPAGITCGNDCTEQYRLTTVVTLTATAATSSTFGGWSGACSGVGTCSVMLDQTRSVTATFALNQHALTVAKAGTGSGSVSSVPAGINCGAVCSAMFNHGTVITLTATPTIGATFAGWSGGCSGLGSCVVTINAAQNVTASFAIISVTPTATSTTPTATASATPATPTPTATSTTPTATASATPATATASTPTAVIPSHKVYLPLIVQGRSSAGIDGSVGDAPAIYARHRLRFIRVWLGKLGINPAHRNRSTCQLEREG